MPKPTVNLLLCARDAAFSPKMVAPDDGKTVTLFGVRFSYKIVSADCGGSLAALRSRSRPAPW